MPSIDEVSNFLRHELDSLLHRKFTADECKIPIFSDELTVIPWTVIHVIDSVNKQYGINFSVSEIVENSLFSIDDLSSSVYRQLFEINK